MLVFLYNTCISQQDIKVMTYNIRLDTPSDGENAWPNRKEFLTSQVLFLAPDILGVQEATPHQVTYLDSVLSNYATIGIGRDGGNKGEHSNIYYNTERLTVEQSHTFWLSKTPNEVSKGWDAALPRVCTYALFTSIDQKKKFWVFNTHLDHVGVEARNESLRLIVKKIKELNNENLPVVLMGDFNVTPDTEIISEISLDLQDAKKHAEVKFGPDGTFNSFNYEKPAARRIDYIFISKSPETQIKKYGVLSSAIDSKFPSDHFPIFVEIRI